MNKIKLKQGQTMLEFAFVSLFFLFMLLLTINVMVAFGVQQYLSYVTFMSARAYHSSGDTHLSNERRALRVLQSSISTSVSNGAVDVPLKFQGFANRTLAVVKRVSLPRAVRGKFGAGAEDDQNFIGLEFEVPLLAFPLGDLGANFQRIKLEARSFLGREVSSSECEEFFNQFLSRFRGSIPGYDSSNHKNMWDNGC